MRALMTDPAVLTSFVVAVAAVLLGVAVRIRPPAAGVVVVAVAAAVVVSNRSLSEYWTSRAADYPWYGLGLLSVTVLSFTLVGWWALTIGRARIELTVVLAALAWSAFTYIPETDLLRALPAPTIVAATATWWRRVVPFGLIGAPLFVAALVWVTVVDGAGRPSSIYGTVASLAAASLLPLVVGRRRQGRQTPAPKTGAGASVDVTGADDPTDPAYVFVFFVFIVVVGRLVGTL